jgi:adenine phosphoribosyltransferase
VTRIDYKGDTVKSKITDLKTFIRDIPDFPKKGIVFKDITPLLKDGRAFRITVEEMARVGRKHKVQKIVAIESRGFLFGSAVAASLGIGVVPVRKKGKLPYKTLSESYQLEYGTDTLEMHVDAVHPGDRLLIVDDVLATGGTARAVAQLTAKAGGKPAAAVFVIELDFLKGRQKLKDLPVVSLIRYS